MPVNYSIEGRYGKSHVALHEDKGVWNRIEKYKSKTDRMGVVNESLKLNNPRDVNSWSNPVDDGFSLGLSLIHI